jgi:hypothetical protein
VPQPKAEKLALPNYPYLNKFSKEQVSAALDRKDRLAEAMTDAIGPDGTWINIPPDMLQILAFHLAYAGGEVFDDLALIESRVRENEANDNGYGLLWEGLREWRPKGEFEDDADKPSDADARNEAQQMAAQLRRQLNPGVRSALAEIFAEEAGAAQAQVNGRPSNPLIEGNIRKLKDGES